MRFTICSKEFLPYLWGNCLIVPRFKSSLQGIQRNQLAMAIIPTTTGVLPIPRLSYSALAHKPHSRASLNTNHLTTNHHATSENEDSAAAIAVPGTTDGAAIGRRGAMVAAAASTVLSLAVEDSKAADSGNPFSKYLKRKKLDPLDTYVPTVVLAQLQFQDVDEKLVGEKPEFSDARSLLRSGPAGSLRNDIRAVAQYAAEAGNGKTADEAVDQCLSALEDLDSLLFRATRETGSVPVDIMKTRVSTAVTALDKLLATVPSNILEKGKAIATAYRDQSTSNDDNVGFDESPDELKGLL